MKKITRFFAYGIFAIFTTTLFSCQDSLSDDTSPIVSENSSSTSNGNASEQGTATTANTLAYISLRLGNNSARTILPSSDQENFTNFVLKGTKSGEAETTLGSWATASSMESANIAVATGTWSFALTANCNGSTYSGSTEKEITTGQNTLSFELSLSENGTGTGSFSITLSFANAENAGSVSYVLATLENTDGESVDSVTQTRLTPTNGSVTFSSTKIPAGTYRARIAFYASTEKDGDFVLATYRELVQISTGLASNATYTIESFNDIYEISYELNGGSFASGTTVGESYSSLSVLTLPQTVTREHYTFDGWYADSECSEGNKVTSTEGQSNNITVYAKWNPTKYAITYEMNGGTISDEAVREYTIEDAVTLTASTYNDSEFLGWFTEAACTGEGITGWKAGEKTGDITLYAKWDKIYATNETIVERIKGLTCSCPIVASGTFSTELIREINGALKELKSKDSKILVSLDLSAVTGLTELEDASYEKSSYSFYACSNLAEIVLPNTVLSIGDSAFAGCTGLTNITIPDSVTSIGDDAFSNCRSLTSITIPDSVTSIGWYAFGRCNSLMNITIPKSVTNIIDGAFSGCTKLSTVYYEGSLADWLKFSFEDDAYLCSNPCSNGADLYINGTKLTDVEIPSTVTSIGYHAFFGCKSITSITIPTSVTRIEREAFLYCTSLKSFYYQGTLADWVAISFSYFSHPCYYGADLYINGTKLTGDVTIPSTATSIGNYAFCGCKSITSVTIPDSVTSIAGYAFEGCTSLRSITIPDSVTSIGWYAFAGCSSLEEITIPFVGSSANATTASKETLFGYSFGTSSYTGGVATEQKYANGSVPVKYYIPESLKKVTVTGGNILYGAFYGCTGLTNIVLGDSVKSIGEKAFSSCSSLEEITISFVGSSVNATTASKETLFGYIFDSDSYTGGTDTWQTYSSSGYSAKYCIPSSLKKVTVTGGNLLYGAFSGCSGLTSITIPDTVTSIGGKVFYNCTGLSRVSVPNGVKSIGDSAFSGCTSLSTVNFEGTLADWLGISLLSTSSHPCYNGADLYINGAKLTDVEIPSTATNIGNYVFYGCKSITSITIPDSVTSIGTCAFFGCSNLESVNIGTKITSFGSYLFSNCTSLKSVYYRGTLADWVGISFSSPSSNPCYNGSDLYISGAKLTDVEIPSTATSIGNYAFYGCTGITRVTIPNNVVSIGDSAFAGCSSLEEMTIPFVGKNASITWASKETLFGYIFGKNSYTGGTATTQCYSTSSSYTYYIPETLKKVTVTGGNLLYGAFYGCYGLASITIPDTVVSIGSQAFYGCRGLTSITIPATVTSIGEYAFGGCSELANITVSTENAQYASEDGILFNKDKTLLIHWPAGKTDSEYTIPNGVTSISPYAFYYCNKSISITIPDTVASIGRKAFYGCRGLTSITIPATVTSIGEYAFGGCTELATVTIPDSVTSIEQYAFAGCTGLTSATIGAGVTSVGRDAFSGCRGLTSVTILDGAKTIGDYMFGGCSILSSVTIPDSVTSIGSSAFSNCTRLTNVTIPDSVTSIGSSAFSGCSALEEITIPFVGGSADATTASKTTLFGYIFGTGSYTGGTSTRQYYSSSGYTSYYIPATLKKVTVTGGNLLYGAFFGCYGLTSITIPDTVASIGSQAFYGCRGLTSITIPATVTSIGEYVFGGCSGLESVTISSNISNFNDLFSYYYSSPSYSWNVPLKSVYYTGTLEDWLSISFTNRSNPCNVGTDLYINGTKVTDVVIPSTVTGIGNYVFVGCKSITSVIIPSSVTSIGSGAFSYCSELTSITIPDTVASIGSLAFYGCTSLTSITIPRSVRSIGSNAFSHCSGLTSVSIQLGVKNIGYGVFYGCTGLTSVTIPTTVTKIEESTFEGCSGLTSVKIVNGVTGIENSAFKDCTSLTSITIPDSVTSIGRYAFSGCNTLTSVPFEDTRVSWFQTDSSSYTSGTNIGTMSSPSTNATRLTDTYYGRYLYNANYTSQ
ncbi:MAG: leucine-rich repeat protein [Treponema sp.]|nr:leucine-rich repeat protein [Treponema sp.]